MSSYWNHTSPYVPGQTITALAQNAKMDGIAAGFDLVEAAMLLRAPLASPTFTGTPNVPTAAANTNTTQIASTAYVMTALTAYAPLNSPTFTGIPAAPTPAMATNTTQLATTAFVQSVVANAVFQSGSIPGYSVAQAGLSLRVNASGVLVWASALNVGAILPDSGLSTYTAGTTDGDLMLIPEVGLYRWSATDTTVPAGCLVIGPTGGGTGRWLLECPGWEVIQAYLAADLTRLHGFADRTLYGSGTCTASSIASIGSFDFNITVTGAMPGDVAVVTPPALLDPRLNWHVAITAANTVSVRINNASASAASSNVGAGVWVAKVTKGVNP